MIFALDTNIIIKYLRNDPCVVQNFRNAVVANHDIIIPQAVNYEICRGFQLVTATKKKANYDILLQDCKIAEMDVPSWKRAETIYENIYHKGFTVGELDILIAAYCLTHNCTIVTNNTKDFENIDGLTIIDWSKT
jgi:tRNA(fMet)-specific endonuclease VapC